MKIIGLIVWFLLATAFASGYIVGAAQQAHTDRPTEPPACTYWGLMQHNPHGLKCKTRITQ